MIVEGVAYYPGHRSGLTHTWTDYSVTNGQQYYYAVTAYDFGSEDFNFYPSENAIAASRTPRGGLVLPPNVVAVRPNPRVLGYVPASADAAVQVAGRGAGRVRSRWSTRTSFRTATCSGSRSPRRLRTACGRRAYTLTDSTTGELLFETGTDFDGQGIGPVGAGLLPIISTVRRCCGGHRRAPGFVPGSPTDARLEVTYLRPVLPGQRMRPGYPDDITIFFYDTVVDTSLAVTDSSPGHAGEVRDHRPYRRRGPEAGLPLPGSSTATARSVRADEIVRRGDLCPGPAGRTHGYLAVPAGIAGGRARIRLPAPATPSTLKLIRPFGADDFFVFDTQGEYLDAAASADDFAPYVVPNPYVGSASFEPEQVCRLRTRGTPHRIPGPARRSARSASST